MFPEPEQQQSFSAPAITDHNFQFDAAAVRVPFDKQHSTLHPLSQRSPTHASNNGNNCLNYIMHFARNVKQCSDTHPAAVFPCRAKSRIQFDTRC